MKNLLFITLIITVCFITACKKENLRTSITGQVLEYDTNIPIEGATVYAYGGTSSGNLSNPGANLTTIGSFITDAQGYYHFSFDAEGYTILDMSASHDQYFPVNTIIQNIFRGKDNEIDIVLDPHAWLKLHVKNTMPVDQYDNISVGNTFGYNNVDLIYGNNVDTTVVGLVKGNNHDVRAIWFVTKSGETQNYNESLFCPAHDTTSFEIFY